MYVSLLAHLIVEYVRQQERGWVGDGSQMDGDGMGMVIKFVGVGWGWKKFHGDWWEWG